MAFSTEDIYAALFALSAPLDPTFFKSRSRVLKVNADVEREAQPSLFQVQLSEPVTQLSGTGPIWRLSPAWVLYINRGEDPKVLPSALINPVLEAVRSVLRPAPGIDKLTLGGRVSYCRIGGPIDIDEGVLGQQAIVLVPIEILAPEDLRC